MTAVLPLLTAPAVIWALVGGSLLATVVYAALALRGHEPGWPRLGCLCRVITFAVMAAGLMASIWAVRLARAARHPAWRAAYLRARIRGCPRGPGNDDGPAYSLEDKLLTDHDFITVLRGWHQDAPEGQVKQ